MEDPIQDESPRAPFVLEITSFDVGDVEEVAIVLSTKHSSSLDLN